MSSETSLIGGDYDWSPLFHPVDLSLLRITLPASLLSIAAQEVMKHYNIVEKAARNVSTNDKVQLRLASIALVNKHVPFRYAKELFRFWEKPLLSVKRIYASSLDNPGLIGDETQQFETVVKAGDLAVTRIINLVRLRVISMNIQNTRAVSLLDLTGFPVRLVRLKRLLAASFTPMERMTVVLDLVVPCGENDIGAEWIQVLSNSHTTLTLRVHSLHMEGLNNVTTMRLLELSLFSNPGLQGVRMAGMECTDWMEIMRAVLSIQLCQHLVSLGLDCQDKLFHFTPNTQVYRSKCINKALVNLRSLERLDLSYNVMSGILKGILPGLSLSYLNVTNCVLMVEDLQMILSLSSLVHLDISLNDGVGEMLGSLVFAVQDTKLPSLEILQIVRCGVTSMNEQNLFYFLDLFPLVKVLDVRFNELNISAIVSLIRRRFEVLVVASPCECSCGLPRNLGIMCGGKPCGEKEVDRVLKMEKYVKSEFSVMRSRNQDGHGTMSFKVMRLGDQT